MLHGWCHVKCHRFGASSVYTIQPCTRLQCHFIEDHIGRIYACLTVTCHLHFWQNDRGLLRATAVTRGWNGYRNKSQHRKLTLEKKNYLAAPPGTFRHESDALTTAIPTSTVCENSVLQNSSSGPPCQPTVKRFSAHIACETTYNFLRLSSVSRALRSTAEQFAALTHKGVLSLGGRSLCDC